MAHREQWWLIGSSGGSLREQWWLIREQWWLILGSSGGSLVGSSGGSLGGSSGGSLVATPDCEAAVLGSNPAISLAYSGLPVLIWAAIWDGTLLKAVL